MSVSSNKYVILLLMNVILLVIGMFMDITPAILIFTPIFLPIAESLGMSNIQFGVMLIFNMCMGNITPPVGSVLFVGCGISKISIEQVAKTLLPYFIVLFYPSAGSYLYPYTFSGRTLSDGAALRRAALTFLHL